MKRLPILAYGHPLLKKVCREVDLQEASLSFLIENMWYTLSMASGVGLAAPQVNQHAQLFVIDNTQETDGIREVFINPHITWYSKETAIEEEACLSIPGISAPVSRSTAIEIEYYDRNFEKQSRSYQGYTARVIQHEYDHVMGILYLDRIAPLKKMMLAPALARIQKGKHPVPYPMHHYSRM